jgi:hypothetical protein
LIAQTKREFSTEFEMEDLGLMHYFLGLEVWQKHATGSVPEEPTIYRQIIGSMMYLVHTRPNICYAMNALGQFMCEPKHIHMVVPNIFSYMFRGLWPIFLDTPPVEV